MKDGIHPDNYRMVVFKDMSNEYAFLSKSAAETKETIQWEDGNEYPLVKIEVSHKSHPSTREGPIRGHRRPDRQVPPEVRQVQQRRQSRGLSLHVGPQKSLPDRQAFLLPCGVDF